MIEPSAHEPSATGPSPDRQSAGSGKKWPSYAKEFLMLFLAVFCGFLAENWRAQLADHEVESGYMKTMMEDLKSDTAQLSQARKYIANRSGMGDSVLTYLSESKYYNDSKTAFRCWRSALGFPDFVQNNRTIQQLKSSGGMRLIRKTAISNAIMAYERRVNALLIHQEMMNDHLVVNTLLPGTIFDVSGACHNGLKKIPGEPLVPFISTDRKAINQAYAFMYSWMDHIRYLDQLFAGLEKEATALLVLIRQEYPEM